MLFLSCGILAINNCCPTTMKIPALTLIGQLVFCAIESKLRLIFGDNKGAVGL